MEQLDDNAAPRPTSGRASPGPDPDSAYDVVVIGGGAAGLAGAVALARSRRRVLVIDAGEPRNAPAEGVHNYLTSEGMAPSALLAAGRAEAAAYGVQVVDATVTGARRLEGDPAEPLEDAHGHPFTVGLADGRAVSSRRLLVATGLIDELPAVPGVAQRWGRDVLHCPYCHGWEARDQAIGILSTGPMTGHAALLWRQLSTDVIVFAHTGPALSVEQNEELASRGIAVVDGEVAALEIAGDRLVGVRLRSGDVVARQVVVVAPRFVARLGMLEGLGLPTADMEVAGHVLARHVPADATGATGVPGVWAAGNVTDPMAQLIAAAAAGLKAGAAINADLVVEDTARAVAAHHTRRPADR